MKTKTLRKIYDWLRVVLGLVILALGMVVLILVPLALPVDTPEIYAYLIFAGFVGFTVLGVRVALQPTYERDAVLRARIANGERVYQRILFAEANFYGVPVVQELNLKQMEKKGSLK